MNYESVQRFIRNGKRRIELSFLTETGENFAQLRFFIYIVNNYYVGKLIPTGKFKIPNW